jgi:sulfate adenylyltransferase subunit 1
VDARKGVLEQTRRHAAVLALLGVPQLVLAVNKIDLVGYDETCFTTIAKEFLAHATALGYRDADVIAIPVSALLGDNVVKPSVNLPWWSGPTLLRYLETVPVTSESPDAPLRFPVQFVIRPGTEEHRDYRGYAGQIATGTVRPGDEVVVLPVGARTTIAGIDTMDGSLASAGPGASVTLRLADDLDIARGDLIAAAADVPELATELDATLCWLAEAPLRAGARVLVKHGTRTTQARIVGLRSRFDEQALTSLATPEFLRLNEIGQVRLAVADALPVEDYTVSRRTGAFLVIDQQDGTTLAAGLIGKPAWGRLAENDLVALG